MPGSNVQLPPLDYFIAFEAAAYCQSFAGASRELNVSETAISRKVRLLELHYDIPLFLRRHRSIHLTAQGQTLLARIGPVIDEIRTISRDMKSGNKGNPVTLAATNSVASLWLMPRLRKFNGANKHVKITLVASDSDQECLGENVDLAILRGDGNWPGFSARLLFGETVFPVCSPGYLKSRVIASAADIPDQDLIGISNLHPEWMDWPTWLANAGVSDPAPDQAAVFNTYPLAIQAAVDGLGIALGWAHLVDHLLDSGALVRPLTAVNVQTDDGYYLLQAEQKQGFSERTIVKNWLLEASAARKRYYAKSH